MEQGFQLTNQGDYVTRIPGPVIRAVLQRGKQGYDYDDIDGLLYVEKNGEVFRIKMYNDGDYGYSARGGAIRTVPRNGAQIIEPDELEELLERHAKGEL